MNLYHHLTRLETILRSREDFDLETLDIILTSLGAVIKVRIKFYDGSQLSISEQVDVGTDQQINRKSYKFHYQADDEKLIFRYDNAPHHRNLATFPAHKHTEDDVIEASPPDLTDVLREIDDLLYS